MSTIQTITKRIGSIIAPQYLNLVLVISIIGFLGSMYFSEVLAFAPCKACWYQRIAAFPIIILAIVAQVTKTRKAYALMLSLTMIGMIIAAFQVADETLGTDLLGIINCDSAACAAPGFELFGIFTIPTLALLMFIALNLILLVTAAYYYVLKNEKNS